MSANTQADLGSEEFALLSDQFRPELLVHCYRMLGSLHDAEDQVQETLLRAWRSYGSFEGRSSLRTWLYRIATNACLRALENRERRPLPSGLGAPGGDPFGPVAPAASEVPWLQPFPDALLRPATADPAAVAAARSGLRLALIAALQRLPARQRTVLILRDVLGWRAAEVADLLGVSVIAVNSALRRARAQLQPAVPAADEIREPSSPASRAILDRYAAAVANADVTALVELLHEDATFEMPPIPTWFHGRDDIGRFLGTHVLTAPGRYIPVPAAANGQPALAVYRRDEDGIRRAYCVQVLSLRGSEIGGVVAFLDPSLFPAFGLPSELPAADLGVASVRAPHPRLLTSGRCAECLHAATMKAGRGKPVPETTAGQDPLQAGSPLRTPRAAAVAGIIFSVLLIAALTVLRLSAPPSPAVAGVWLTDSAHRAALAIGLNLVPFAGIAFLWFVGVLRDRIGEREDRFFATVLLGSGLLFVGMLFVGAAVAGANVASVTSSALPAADTLALNRNVATSLLNVYAMRMAAVFTLTTVTIARRTQIVSRWLTLAGLACAVVLMVGIGISPWVELLFPLWILALSLDILSASIRASSVQRPIIRSE